MAKRNQYNRATLAVPVKFDKKTNITGSLTVSGDIKMKKTNPGAGISWEIKEQMVSIDSDAAGHTSTTGSFIPATSSVQCLALYATASSMTGENQQSIQYIGFKDGNRDRSHGDSTDLDQRGQNYFYTSSIAGTKPLVANEAVFFHPSGSVSNFFTSSCEIDVQLESATVTGSFMMVLYYKLWFWCISR